MGNSNFVFISKFQILKKMSYVLRSTIIANVRSNMNNWAGRKTHQNKISFIIKYRTTLYLLRQFMA